MLAQVKYDAAMANFGLDFRRTRPNMGSFLPLSRYPLQPGGGAEGGGRVCSRQSPHNNTFSDASPAGVNQSPCFLCFGQDTNILMPDADKWYLIFQDVEVRNHPPNLKCYLAWVRSRWGGSTLVSKNL